jgi:hypothetical protein
MNDTPSTKKQKGSHKASDPAAESCICRAKTIIFIKQMDSIFGVKGKSEKR